MSPNVPGVSNYDPPLRVRRRGKRLYRTYVPTRNVRRAMRATAREEQRSRPNRLRRMFGRSDG